MTPTPDRVNWVQLDKNYRHWREDGAWITVAPLYGYDVVNARTCGTEIILLAMADDPDWVKDMCDHGCDLALALLDMIWDKGYAFDELMWYDDMAYRNGMMFSKAMWREIVMPYQKRTIDWAHSHGIKVHLHCCGRITELVPDLIALGLDALNPLEVKAGMDPANTKKTHGRDLVLRGGIGSITAAMTGLTPVHDTWTSWLEPNMNWPDIDRLAFDPGNKWIQFAIRINQALWKYWEEDFSVLPYLHRSPLDAANGIRGTEPGGPGQLIPRSESPVVR